MPRPRVSAVGHDDAQLQRAEAGLRLGLGVQKVADLLIDRRAFGPAGGRVAAALDIAGEELDAGQQAAHAAHVSVAVAADLVREALEEQQPVLERLERRDDLLERERIAYLVGPELIGQRAVGAEHDDQPLLARRCVGES